MKQDITLIPNEKSIYLKQISQKTDIIKEEDCDGYLIETSGDEKEARRIVESLKNKNKILAVVGNNNVFNRRVLETMKIDYFVSPEKTLTRDTLKQRESGLNHVIAKIAAKKKIVIVINFSEIIKLSKEDKAKRISKIIQNIEVCKKAKCEIRIATFAKNKNQLRTKKELQNFILSLGKYTALAKESTLF